MDRFVVRLVFANGIVGLFGTGVLLLGLSYCISWLFSYWWCFWVCVAFCVFCGGSFGVGAMLWLILVVCNRFVFWMGGDVYFSGCLLF